MAPCSNTKCQQQPEPPFIYQKPPSSSNTKESFDNLNNIHQSSPIITEDDTESPEPPLQPVSPEEDIIFQLHPQRWFVLASYCLLSLVCGSNWLCFPAVSNILREYYQISILSINMLSIVFGICLVLFSIPFALLLNKYGLAVVMQTSAFLNLTGALIKYFGDDADHGYWFLLCGNTFHALSVAGFLFLPGDIASTWFGEHEAGKATSLCVAFDALGTGVGFLLATTIVQGNEDPYIVQGSIKQFLLSQLIPSVAVFLFVLLFVRRRPPHPPNFKELAIRRDEMFRKHVQLQYLLDIEQVLDRKGNVSEPVHVRRLPCIKQHRILMSSLFKLIKNTDFQLIFHMQGIVASIEGLYEILLNEMLIDIFPGSERAIGILGFVSVILGFTTNILVGALIDKTGHYRRVSFIVFFLTTILASLWYIAIEYIHNFLAISIILSLLMSISTSYYTIAFAHGAQVADNVSASAIGVMLVLTSQIYDTMSSFVATEILSSFGSSYVNGLAITLCVVATMLSFFVGNGDNKRTEVAAPAHV
ncbi:uncharacterized MFS-type transporter C09D4.1-like [Clytia hemisphaerica]|uniref:Uncharacterized protein n=1 Tax=Clytia hemisphaerica TaxID=252671 RepID=A0A7M6DM33_9CNID